MENEPDERIEWGDAEWGDDDEKGWNEPIRRTLVRKFLEENLPLALCAVALAVGLVVVVLGLQVG